jgi:hypothetical protein
VILNRSDEIREVLVQACARNEMLILVTPFLRFESYFVSLDGSELQVAATMSREDAVYGMRDAKLRIRFPVELGFMEGPVSLLGLGLADGRPTLRLTPPNALEESDYRASYRVERVGRVTVTFSTPRGELLEAALVDIGTRGARLHLTRTPSAIGLDPGARLLLTIPLTAELRLEAGGEIRHTGPRTVGLEFNPRLPEAEEEELSRWVFRRREEDQERLARRVELNRQIRRGAKAGGVVPGILLVSADSGLEAALRPLMEPLQPFTRIAPSTQALKDALMARPSLAVFHLADAGLDQRRRTKALVELAVARVPVLLLGTQVDAATLFELSGAWKAASAMVWNPARGAFLQRLAQGIIRRNRQGGEGPLAPTEA